MTGYTPTYGLPYPESTTPITDSAAIVQELAEKIDATLDAVTAAEVSGATGAYTYDTANRSGWGVYTWTGSGTVTLSRAGFVDLCLVAGGGGGGQQAGNGFPSGGGGGGGMLERNSYYLPAGTYTVTIGAGGAQNYGGGPTKLTLADNSVELVAYGGGYGGGFLFQMTRNPGSYYYNESTHLSRGEDGGSGGGMRGAITSLGSHGRPGYGNCNGLTTGQGNNGGGWPGSSIYGGGGGGGAGGPGGTPTSANTGMYGGPGRYTSISGISTPYAGGGGGAHQNSEYALAEAAGGVGGGGQGAGNGGWTFNATVNTGGGGGGRYNLHTAGQGGSGIAILAVAL